MRERRVCISAENGRRGLSKFYPCRMRKGWDNGIDRAVQQESGRKGEPRVEGKRKMSEILNEIVGLARIHTVLLVLILFAVCYLCWEDWRW